MRDVRVDVRIAGLRVRVIGPADLLAELRQLFPPAPAWNTALDDEVGAVFRLERDPARAGWHRISRDGVLVWASPERDELLPRLEWAISTLAVERLGRRYVFLHAGAVAWNGRGLLLPATSGGGKTTLVAGLIAAGFAYLSDEVAALDPTTSQLLPFPKSLCIKEGARRALAPLYPQLTESVPRRRFGGEPVWYLSPPEGAWPSRPIPARYVVLPRYQAGARTTLAPIARTAALPDLLGQSFNLRAHGGAGVGSIVALLRATACFSLTIGDLGAAVEQLQRLVAG